MAKAVDPAETVEAMEAVSLFTGFKRNVGLLSVSPTRMCFGHFRSATHLQRGDSAPDVLDWRSWAPIKFRTLTDLNLVGNGGGSGGGSGGEGSGAGTLAAPFALIGAAGLAILAL